MQLPAQVFEIIDVPRLGERMVSKIVKPLQLIKRRQKLASLACLCSGAVNSAMQSGLLAYLLSADRDIDH